jgi:WD40 repeat protein
MGEVYRARDPRLRRDVAVKVLHAEMAEPEHVERLAREARAAGALNHPNILAVYDVGTDHHVPYVVSELLEGESLRQRLDRGRLPYRKALEYGAEIAQALAAAHTKGIVHRDVKPGNVFVTDDGRVKLLDFGIAKVDRVGEPADTDDSTLSATGATYPGLGTSGYMAPEQILGERIDERTDIFALGAVVYEMLTGHRAFRRETRAETMAAILNEDPVDPAHHDPTLPPAAVATVRRCLEKKKEERFQSARDLAFELRLLEQTATGPGTARAHGTRPRGRWWVVAAALAAAVVGMLVGRVAWPPAPPTVTFQRLSFHRGRIGGARFTTQGVVYSQAVEGNPLEVWLTQPDGPESLSLGYSRADVLTARGGKLALAVDRRFAGGERFVGTLAEAPLGGGLPRQIQENVEDADWDPSGTRLAVARSRGQGAPSQLEYPLGKRLYPRAASPANIGSIHFPRVSRDGHRVAFLEDPAGAGGGGRIMIVDESGKEKVLTREWSSARGLAWSPKGDEIWFAAGNEEENRAIRAVDLSGHERIVLEAPGALTIWDTAADGRTLITRDDSRKALMGVPPGSSREQDLSWFDATGLGRLSSDGAFLLFGDRFGVYLRRTDGSQAVKLGFEGAWADDLSPDGRLVLATSASADHLILVPTGPGDPQPLPTRPVNSLAGARWFPDGRRILVNGREEGRDIRSYVMDVSGGAPQPLTTEGIWALSVSPDGRLAAAIGSGRVTLWDTAGGQPRDVRGSEPHDRPVAWTPDGGSLWVFRRGEMPARIYRIDLASGRRQLWKTIAPADLAGVYSITDFEVTPDGASYFYSYRRVLSELYVVRGLR